MPEITRRDFLKMATGGMLTAAGLVGLGMLARLLGHPTEKAPQTIFDLGPASDAPAGSRTLFADIPALLIHTEGGFSALSLVCTHLGCTVEQETDGFTCPCHGSRFDGNGRILQGPAKEGLHALRVETDEEGHLILFTSEEAALRTGGKEQRT